MPPDQECCSHEIWALCTSLGSPAETAAMRLGRSLSLPAVGLRGRILRDVSVGRGVGRLRCRGPRHRRLEDGLGQRLGAKVGDCLISRVFDHRAEGLPAGVADD
jgi:hypothetical protein